MYPRRRFVQLALAAGAMVQAVPLAAQDRFDQDALLAFDPVGRLTLMHLSDIRGHHTPHFYRPAEVSLATGGDPAGKPHLVGEAFRIAYGIGGRTPMDYAFTHEEFVTLAQAYGPIGGLDRVQTVVSAIRAARPGALCLVGGEVDGVAQALQPDVITSGGSPVPERKMFMRDGVQIAVVTFAAKPGALRDLVILAQDAINQARTAGAAVVVGLSQMGIAVDQALAAEVTGLDIILSGHDHIALPEPMQVKDTFIYASGGQGRFVNRIDIDVQEGRVVEVQSKLIPMFSDLIRPDAEMAALIAEQAAEVETLGTAAQLLFRRGSLGSTWDDLIMTAMMRDQGADVALVPGLRWGASVLPGQRITRQEIDSICGSATVRNKSLTVARIKELLEEAAEGAFASDLYQRTGRDMMRAGGLAFELAPGAAKGARIGAVRLLGRDKVLEDDTSLRVALWEDAEAGNLSALVADFIRQHGTTMPSAVAAVTLSPRN